MNTRRYTGSRHPAGPLRADPDLGPPITVLPHPRWRRYSGFLLAGSVAFLVDAGLFNLLLRAHIGPLSAKLVAAGAATAVSYLINSAVAFTGKRTTTTTAAVALFVAVNIAAMLVGLLPLAVSHYVCGYTSTLADNVAGLGIGTVLGTAVRYAGYRWIVFTP